MTKKIIAVNSASFITDPVLNDFLREKNPIWRNFVDLIDLLPAHQVLYSRIGTNFLPFQTPYHIQDISAPKLDTAFSLTFAQTTDQRYHDLKRKQGNKSWIVMWSGGLDSTVILTSILKNSSPADRQNITVACNRISIYENPLFYYQHIKPNFSVIDSTHLIIDQEKLINYCLINGDPADALYAGASSQGMLLDSPDDFNRNLRTDPDRLIKFISQKTNYNFADWFYQSVLTNINSVDVPVITYHDFFWWIQFNLTWVSDKFRCIQQGLIDKDSYGSYIDNFVNWFNSNEYQQWSMNNNHAGIKYGSHLRDYKLANKNYIYDFDKDLYYRTFKVKSVSLSLRQKNLKNAWNCILDDFSTLSIDEDLDQILELLPAHFNQQ